MTLEKRVKSLEGRVTRLHLLSKLDTLTPVELKVMTLDELAALFHRMNQAGSAGRPDLGKFQAKLDAMTDAELLGLYQSYGTGP